MPLQVGLNLLTLAMCVITLTLATAALMPQITHGLRLLRDGVLWAILLGIIAFVGVVGWSRLYEIRTEAGHKENKAASVLRELLDSSPREENRELDPLPLPTAKSPTVRVAESVPAAWPIGVTARTRPITIERETSLESISSITQSTSAFKANRSRSIVKSVARIRNVAGPANGNASQHMEGKDISSEWTIRPSRTENDWTARGPEQSGYSDWNR